MSLHRVKSLLFALLAFSFCILVCQGSVAEAAVKSLTVSEKKLDLFVGQSTVIEVTAKLDDGSEQIVTEDCDWSSGNEEAVTVSQGQIVASGAGKAVVIASYENKSAKITVNVKPVITNLEISASSLTLTKGSSANVKVYAVYGTGKSDKMNVTSMCEWESTDEDYAKVSSSGKITAVAPGTATITGKFDPYNDGRFDSQTIVNVTIKPTIKSLSAESTNIVLTSGLRKDFPVTAIYTDNTEEDVTDVAEFKISNKSIVSYDSGGLTGLAPGKATVTITFAGKKTTVTVNVVANISGISISPSSVPELVAGQVKYLKAKLTHSKGTLDVTDTAEWASSNESVATVTGGKVTAGSAGTAVITAIYGTYTSQVTVSVDRSINTLSPSVTTTSASPLLLIKDDPIMGKQQISVTAVYNDTSQVDVTDKVVWKTSNSKVANVLQIGNNKYINAVGKGTATITGTTQGKSFTVNVKVTPAIQSILVSESLIDLEVGTTKKLKITATYSDSSTADVTSECTYTSSDTGVATVVSGTITPVAEGTANITIAHTGASSVTAVVHVVNPVQQMSIFVDNTITSYKTIPPMNQFTAVAKLKRSTSESAPWEVPTTGLTWLSSNNSVATVNESGSVQGISPGTAVITARYGTYVASLTVTVANTLITSISPSVMTQGTSFDLTVSGSGTHFSTATSLVYVGNQPVPVKSSSGSTNIVVTVPDSVQPGKHDVRVITGSEDVTLKESLTILPALAVSSASTSSDGSTIEVLFNQSIKLSTGLTSATGANGFTLTITGGPPSTVTGIAIKSGNDKVLTLTLDRAITSGSTITLTYNNNIVRNLAGDDFTTKPVTQTVVNATPDQQAPYYVSGATSTDGTTISLTFNESMALTASDKKAGFSVNGSSTRIMGAAIDATNGKVVVLTLSPLQPVASSEVVKVSYSKVLGGYNVKDLAGNCLNDLANESVTNNVTAAASGPTGMTIESATLNVDGNLVLTGTLFTQGNTVDVTKIEIVDSDLYNGAPIALRSSGATATINSATQITIALGANNTSDLQGVLGPGVMLNARQGWLKLGSIASTDPAIYGKPVTVTNALPTGMTITSATVYRYGADWSVEVTGTNMNIQGGTLDITKLTLTDTNGSVSSTSASYTFQQNDINTGGIAVNSGGTTATITLNSTGKTNLSTAIPNLGNGTVTLDAAAGWYKDAAGQAATDPADNDNATDVINPLEITGVNSYDDTGDGMIDRITVTFSENLKNTSTGANNWTFKDANGSLLTVGTIPSPINTNILTVPVTSASFNTGKLTEVSYRKDGTGDVTYDSSTIQNALEDVTVSSTIISDNAAPFITARETQDLDSDGKIDAVKITFSEAIKDSTVTATDFNIEGYDGEAFSSTTNSDVADNNIIYITFTEGGINTASTPNITYTLGTLKDLATVPNSLASTGALATTDKAAPVIASWTMDMNLNGDAKVIEFNFSEPVTAANFNLTKVSIDKAATGSAVVLAETMTQTQTDADTVTVTTLTADKVASIHAAANIKTSTEAAYTLVLASGAMTDGTNSSIAVASGLAPATFTADSTAPKVTSFAASATAPNATFDDYMDTSTLINANISFTENDGGSETRTLGAYNTTTRTQAITISNAGATAGDTITFLEDAVKDIAGNGIDVTANVGTFGAGPAWTID